jgi:hypothetical protein
MEIDRDLVFVVKGTEMVPGEPDLGERLTELFLGVLADSPRGPARIIFLGTGIFLTTEGTPYLDRLRALEERGVELVSCSTCLAYYDRKEKLVAGRAGNMKDTVESLLGFGKVVTI